MNSGKCRRKGSCASRVLLSVQSESGIGARGKGSGCDEGGSGEGGLSGGDERGGDPASCLLVRTGSG